MNILVPVPNDTIPFKIQYQLFGVSDWIGTFDSVRYRSFVVPVPTFDKKVCWVDPAV
ncbi:hypothetical protein HanXRQr2_Chr11g0513961 [Helianthus annuus]|uniref:Uncharacterized protein n=1 Tax=Helianthus annuus TaxID=4232 RepID=A0A9K3N2D7_HELAN|nr:hypothetical protein HanXRQr2_Chr11g0513961 [Helianthus annuus]